MPKGNFLNSQWSVLLVFSLCLFYWIFLSWCSSPEISTDALGYQELGSLLYQKGWVAYFSELRREPLYPFLISVAMYLANVWHISYLVIIKLFQIILFLISGVLLYKLLCKLKISPVVRLLIIFYFGISPALLNSVLSLFSEIATYPFVLGIILFSHRAWEQIQKEAGLKAAILNGTGLAVMFLGLTFVKGITEYVFPLYILPFGVLFLTSIRKHPQKAVQCLLFLSLTIMLYEAPVFSYKCLNKKYNGNFTFTNRGPWALYGDTARRMEPLTFKHLLSGLSYIPGEGMCEQIFGSKECYSWSVAYTDVIGLTKFQELQMQKLSPTAIDQKLFKLSVEKILINPFQYVTLTALEGLKIFFWESTKVGFVNYPSWLERIYNQKLFKNVLRLACSLITFIAFLWSVIYIFSQRSERSSLCFFMIFFIMLFTVYYSLFFIVTRYTFSLVPLFLALIALMLDHLLVRKQPQ